MTQTKGSSGSSYGNILNSQLAEWRRKLIKCPVELETHDTRSELQGVAESISRLQRSGAIPRETAALMCTITEIRNAAEYQDKTLSAAESRVVWAAWEALVRNGLMNAACLSG